MTAPAPVVAVTGMGCVCAPGGDPETAMGNLYAGFHLLTPPAALGPDALDCPFFAADATGVDIFPGGRRFSSADTLALARYAALQALRQAGLQGGAGLDGTEVNGVKDRVNDMALIVGTTAGSALHFLRGYAAVRAGTPTDSCDIADYFSCNPALALVQELRDQQLAVGGPLLTVANACTSGTDALGLGLDMVRRGRCEIALCGGADALSLVPHTGFARLMIYDRQPCRPFDATRRGLNLGEGAAFVVLESERHARQRGATIWGRVLGYGSGSDAHHFTAPHPEGRGLKIALRRALSEAGLSPTALAFVNAHGTGTRENDKVEGGVFRRELPEVPVWASKGSTGHTLGAAGALEAVFCLVALRRGAVPASVGFSVPDPEIGISPTTRMKATRSPYAVSTSLGFGGGNAAVVLAAGEDA